MHNLEVNKIIFTLVIFWSLHYAIILIEGIQG